MSLFHLDWPRDLDGYDIEMPKPPTGRGALLLTGDVGPQIIRKGGRLDIRQPLKAPGLCRWLAACRPTPQGALELVSRFGFLFRAKARKESVAEICEAIETARQLVIAADAKDWQRITQWLTSAGQDKEIFVHGGIGRLGIQFVIAEGAPRPDLRLRPANLFHAALVQLLEEVSSGRPLRKCLNPTCPEWFTYGPGTEHRETARYHSARCKDAHTYMKRKGVAK